MTTASIAARRTCLFLGLIAGSLPLAACTTESDGHAQQARADRAPATGNYRCGAEGVIRVENFGGRVRVTEAIPDPKHPEILQRDPVELTASPPNQRNRYGIEGYALVIEGREALWMRAGAVPRTCNI